MNVQRLHRGSPFLNWLVFSGDGRFWQLRHSDFAQNEYRIYKPSDYGTWQKCGDLTAGDNNASVRRAFAKWLQAQEVNL